MKSFEFAGGQQSGADSPESGLNSGNAEGIRSTTESQYAPPACPRETVDHPSHYNAGKFEVIDVIADWQLNFTLGCVVKYVARAKYKGSELEDLKKARWYLDYEIKQLEGSSEDSTAER
jgi:hypothetical protein